MKVVASLVVLNKHNPQPTLDFKLEKEMMSAGVSLIEEVGGYRILNRRVPLRFLWLALFNTLTKKAGTAFTVYGCRSPGSQLLITTLVWCVALAGFRVVLVWDIQLKFFGALGGKCWGW